MKFDLSIHALTIEGQPMKRNAANKEYSDAPLTLAFAVAHVLSVAMEDLNARYQLGAQQEQQALQPTVDSTVKEQALATLRAADEEKSRRGALALRIAQDDPAAVELSAEEVMLILHLSGPRLTPTVLSQLRQVLN